MNVIVFDSTHFAIFAEKTLKNFDIKADIIPTPREISASCGLSIKFSYEDLEKIKDIIVNQNITINGIYEISDKEKGRTVKKL